MAPASAPALDRDELADDLQRAQNLDRGHELAIVVLLAEAGEQPDPALRAEPADHARDEFADADLSGWSASVSAALQRRVLDGLHVDAGARSLQIDWRRAHVCRGDARAHLAIRLVDGDTVQRAHAEVRLPSHVARASARPPNGDSAPKLPCATRSPKTPRPTSSASCCCDHCDPTRSTAARADC